MPSYPTTIYAPSLKTSGQIIQATHINDPEAEITAMETELLTSGTWTPTLGGSGGTSGQTYALRQGIYAKTGRVVQCVVALQFSAKGTVTGNVQLEGLPVVPLTTAGGQFVDMQFWQGWGRTLIGMSLQLTSATTATLFVTTVATTDALSVAATSALDLTDSSGIRATFSYISAA